MLAAPDRFDLDSGKAGIKSMSGSGRFNFPVAFYQLIR
jgi:hypothetical protein